MKKNEKHTRLLFFCVFLVLLDQSFKYIANSHADKAFYIIRPYLGWELHLNPGIAFGVPIPSSLTVLTTPIILIVFYRLFIHGITHRSRIQAFALVMSGAISNFIDRLFIGATIDYFRFTTSIFNIADLAIVAGVVLFLWALRHPESLQQGDSPKGPVAG